MSALAFPDTLALRVAPGESPAQAVARRYPAPYLCEQEGLLYGTVAVMPPDRFEVYARYRMGWRDWWRVCVLAAGGDVALRRVRCDA